MAKASRSPQQASFTVDPAEVQRLDEISLKWTNLLRIKSEISEADREQRDIYKEITKLQGQELTNANSYLANAKSIERLEKSIQRQRAAGSGTAGIRNTQRIIDNLKGQQQQLAKTTGGALRAQEVAAAKQKASLLAERDLIKAVNKERGLGDRVMDLFRSKQARQRQIDLARIRAGGGVNPPTGGGGRGTAGTSPGGNQGGKAALLAAALGVPALGAIIAGIAAAIDKIKAPFKALGSLIKGNLTSPLAQASSLVSGGIGGGYGIGGGGISGAGATSLLGGLQSVVSTIPLIGGVLGGIVGLFKTVVDLVLGIDQGITNFARNLGISKTQAAAVKEQFIEIRKNTDSIIINETRLMESQVELTKALGVRSRFSSDILENNIKLKEIAGVELETRKALVQTSLIQGRSADELTKSVLAQSKAFEFQTGIAFEYRDVLGQASKQAGALGLVFSKYPEKLTKALVVTKAMGYELKQLDSIANSFLDFESSISKEMEAQVLTGKQLNLTTAREAALNNDLVTLAKEINSQVGSTQEFLGMNRIQQEAIAAAVGMSRDGLADVLKQQEYYKKLGATNLKQAQEELKLLRERGLSEKEINKMIGEDAYNYITQTSTAERLTELMNSIKNIFIEFVQKSGILDFITNPQKIQAFAQGLITRFAGAVQLIGDIIASLIEGIGSLPFTDKAKWEGLARSVRTGTTEFAGGLKGAAGTLGKMNLGGEALQPEVTTPKAGYKGVVQPEVITPKANYRGGIQPEGTTSKVNYGEAAPSIGKTVQQITQQNNSTTIATTSPVPKGREIAQTAATPGDVYLDGQKVGYILFNRNANQIPGLNKT